MHLLGRPEVLRQREPDLRRRREVAPARVDHVPVHHEVVLLVVVLVFGRTGQDEVALVLVLTARRPRGGRRRRGGAASGRRGCGRPPGQNRAHKHLVHAAASTYNTLDERTRTQHSTHPTERDPLQSQSIRERLGASHPHLSGLTRRRVE